MQRAGFHQRGLAGWFVDAAVVPGPQGSVTLRFAPGTEGTVPILIWDPPRRIRFGIADGGRVHDITATAGGSRVQLHDEGVHDAEAAAAAAGWTGFLGRLRMLWLGRWRGGWPLGWPAQVESQGLAGVQLVYLSAAADADGQVPVHGLRFSACRCMLPGSAGGH